MSISVCVPLFLYEWMGELYGENGFSTLIDFNGIQIRGVLTFAKLTTVLLSCSFKHFLEQS